ncbi:hypothetical protein C8J57DRAFT_1519623 [Mycena rebaudengoi]|nr:hypothetical protein C8J57DRAFT_1519623 [Mycena rebaudengoi]
MGHIGAFISSTFPPFYPENSRHAVPTLKTSPWLDIVFTTHVLKDATGVLYHQREKTARTPLIVDWALFTSSEAPSIFLSFALLSPMSIITVSWARELRRWTHKVDIDSFEIFVP